MDDIEWVITGYMLAFSAFMPLTSWLRTRLGYRFLYIASLGVFTAGSVLCGIAPTLPTLVIARIIQALGGGAMTPTGMALIAEVFPPEERGKALGVWGAGIMVGPALGPTLGGYLTETLGWRSIFNINLPIGLLGLIATRHILRRDRPRGRPSGSFDLSGFLFLSTFLISALLGLSKGNQEGWTSAFVVICGLVSAVSLVFFIAVESLVEDGILDLGLLRNGPFTVALVVTGARSVALFGGTFLMPLFLQNQMGQSETDTGLLLLPGAVMVALTTTISGRLSERFGPRVPTLFGLALAATFMWLCRRLDATTSTWGVLFPTLLRGAGLGLLVTPVMTAAMNAVPTKMAGMASSMLSLTQQVAGSLGIALLASVLGHRATFHLAVTGQGLELARPAFAEAVLRLTERAAALGLSPDQAELLAQTTVAHGVGNAAGVLAFNDAFLVGAVVILLGMVPALFLSSRTRTDRESIVPGPEMLE